MSERTDSGSTAWQIALATLGAPEALDRLRLLGQRGIKMRSLEVAATGQDSAIRQTRRVETVSEASIYTLRDGRVSMHKLLSSPSTVLISV